MTSSTSKTRSPIPFTDRRGIACLRVPLDDAGTDHALVEREDYDRVVRDLGASPVWQTTGNGRGRRYVVLHAPIVQGHEPGLLTVARLIVEAGPRECVRYATRDTFDLRRPNLVTRPGSGRSRRHAQLVLAQAVRRRDAVHVETQPTGPASFPS